MSNVEIILFVLLVFHRAVALYEIRRLEKKIDELKESNHDRP